MSNIFDVAKKAGVSITTVSRALNGYSDVSEVTRKRIIEIAGDLNYYPSSVARNLQGGRTDTVAFAPLLREHVESEQFFREFLSLLTLSAFRHDLSLLATVADNPGQSGKTYRELAGSGRVDGIILADIKPQDERIALMEALGMPFVAFGRTEDYEDRRYPLVDVDNEAGMQSVVDYLTGAGHRLIAYLSGPLDTSYSLQRYSGYREGLAQHGLPLDRGMVIANLQAQSDTVEALDRLLAQGHDKGDSAHRGDQARPTAIVAANDHLALDVVRGLQARGIVVGSGEGCIAVTGFDDLPFSAYIQPPLTTVRQPITAIADMLLDLLVVSIKSEVDGKKKQSMPTVAAKQEREKQPDGQSHVHVGARSAEPSYVKWIGPRQALVKPELVVRASA